MHAINPETNNNKMQHLLISCKDDFDEDVSSTHQQLSLKSFRAAVTLIIVVFTLTSKHYNFLTLRWNESFCCFVIRLLKYLLGVFSMKYLLLSVLYCAWSVLYTIYMHYNCVTIILLLISLGWLALTLKSSGTLPAAVTHSKC